MTKKIPHRSLEHTYLPARDSADTCHWCSLPPVYHQNVPRYATPRGLPASATTTVPSVSACETPCVFLDPCDASCHETHWLIPIDHDPEDCPARASA